MIWSHSLSIKSLSILLNKYFFFSLLYCHLYLFGEIYSIFFKFISMDYLFVSCPAVDCTNPDKTLRYWYHNGCGGKTMIRYSDIFIVCSSCYQSGIMFDWNFRCAAHNFRSTSKQGCLYALTIMAQQSGNADQIRSAITQILKFIWNDLYTLEY